MTAQYACHPTQYANGLSVLSHDRWKTSHFSQYSGSGSRVLQCVHDASIIHERLWNVTFDSLFCRRFNAIKRSSSKGQTHWITSFGLPELHECLPPCKDKKKKKKEKKKNRDSPKKPEQQLEVAQKMYENLQPTHLVPGSQYSSRNCSRLASCCKG